MQLTADTSKARERLAELAAMDVPIRKRMSWYMSKLVLQAKIHATRGEILKAKTGQLGRNVSGRVGGDKNTVDVVVGTGIPPNKPVAYASIHEYGGKITPKRAKNLTIPLPGVKGVIRDYQDGFFLKSKTGKVLYCIRDWKKVKGGENYKSAGIRPLFLLRKEVTIPARRWLGRAIDASSVHLTQALNPAEIVREIGEGD